MITDTKHDSFMKNIDTEEKAYFLGWVACAGNINDSKIHIEGDDKDIISRLSNCLCKEICLIENENKIGFIFSSQQMIDDIYIYMGNNVDQLPCDKFNHKKLGLDFLRGCFDSYGKIGNDIYNSPYFTIYVKNTKKTLIDQIKKYINIPCINSEYDIKWSGTNAIDLLYELYKDAKIYEKNKYKIFCQLANCLSIEKNKLPCFKWKKTIPDAITPSKSRFTDAGYDLTLIKLIKHSGNVYYYDTGIAVQPENGYYFDLVGRSSISKSGWSIANNVGIIDASYRGSIIVALLKNDQNTKDIELPNRLVQIIPRQVILMEPIEVEELDDTSRGEGGFGSSGK